MIQWLIPLALNLVYSSGMSLQLAAIRLNTDIITEELVVRCPAVATHHTHEGHLAVGVGVNPPRHDQPAPSLYGGHPLTNSQARANLPGGEESQGKGNF